MPNTDECQFARQDRIAPVQLMVSPLPCSYRASPAQGSAKSMVEVMKDEKRAGMTANPPSMDQVFTRIDQHIVKVHEVRRDEIERPYACCGLSDTALRSESWSAQGIKLEPRIIHTFLTSRSPFLQGDLWLGLGGKRLSNIRQPIHDGR